MLNWIKEHKYETFHVLLGASGSNVVHIAYAVLQVSDTVKQVYCFIVVMAVIVAGFAGFAGPYKEEE